MIELTTVTGFSSSQLFPFTDYIRTTVIAIKMNAMFVNFRFSETNIIELSLFPFSYHYTNLKYSLKLLYEPQEYHMGHLDFIVQIYYLFLK